MQSGYGYKETIEAELNTEQERKAPPSPGPSDSPADPPFLVDGREVSVVGDI